MTQPFLKLSFPLWIALFSLVPSSNSCTEKNSPLAPTGLLCELLSDPSQAVITDDKPEFGWIVNDSRSGAMQSAFQILVASSKNKIQENDGDLGDSGKVSSTQSINIE